MEMRTRRNCHFNFVKNCKANQPTEMYSSIRRINLFLQLVNQKPNMCLCICLSPQSQPSVQFTPLSVPASIPESPHHQQQQALFPVDLNLCSYTPQTAGMIRAFPRTTNAVFYKADVRWTSVSPLLEVVFHQLSALCPLPSGCQL